MRAVFLDRDGTMVHDVGYLSRVEDVRWFPYTVDAIRLLNRAGFLVCVTTNQGGVGLGLYDEPAVHALHNWMDRTLTAAGARIDAWFYCPHHPQAITEELRRDCECRKPAAGMIRQAAARFAFDPSASFVIGDKLLDVEMAGRAGGRGILVRTGYGDEVVKQFAGIVPGAAHVAATLMEATAWLLGQTGPHSVRDAR
jgi:D-glycero-D-manno-heptose 1,7-bisphosphate phosphatase